MRQSVAEEARCHHFATGYCRSCSLLTLTRDEELRRKEDLVRGEIAEQLSSKPVVFPIFSPSVVLPSRSKAKLQVTGSIRNPILGLIEFDGRSLDARELLDCPLHLPKINEALTYLAKHFIPDHRISPYQLKERRGELKAIIIIANADGSEMIVRFVCRSRDLEPRLQKGLNSLMNAIPEIRVVTLNVQPVAHAILEGSEEIVLTAQQSIREEYDGFTVELGPQSFKQVTHAAATALYSTAREKASELKAESVLDLYCGAGAFSLALAGTAKRVIGVDLSDDAVQAARRAGAAFPQLKFEAADLEKDFRRFFSPLPDLLVVNPPRRGLSAELTAALCELKPRSILYSSCNPKTLLRDLLVLESEYRVTELHPLDMFPQTAHLEVLAVAEKKV